MIFVPLSDDNPTRSVAWVNLALIASNVMVFLYAWTAQLSGVSWLAASYGVIPAHLTRDPAAEALTILSAMFLHADWAHLGSNLLFLYIFGDNLEDVMGRGRYLGFYLGAGTVAALVHVVVDPASEVPMIGASGAIFGVIAGYLLLFPRAPILTFNALLPLWLFIGPLPVVPAWIVAAEYLVVNVVSGVVSLGQPLGLVTGTAFFAHIGGALGGLLLTRPLVVREIPARRWQGWRSRPRRP